MIDFSTVSSVENYLNRQLDERYLLGFLVSGCAQLAKQKSSYGICEVEWGYFDCVVDRRPLLCFNFSKNVSTVMLESQKLLVFIQGE